MLIESFQNPKVKLLGKLKNKRARDQTSLFFVEGYREILRLSEGETEIDMLFYCPELFLQDNEKDLIEKVGEKTTQIYRLPKAIFEKISMRDRPDGLALIAKQKRLGFFELEEILKNEANPFFCIAESIEKPGNLGSILRSCDAVGINGLIVCDECTDVYNPNVVRSSVGTLFTVPIFQLTSKETIALLYRYNCAIVTTSPSAKQNYTDVDYRGAVAIAMGTEQVGLTEQWFNEKFEQVSIPMMGKADSLNVANATTLLLYEVLRQRR
ncbi:MAG: RNA methyltransferase [Rhabdochlamydiaceae bacterium]|nr:RNA methyltransferase [Candidatus Amphrikana amoebophyrae]